ncbi:uncharacterized protein [Ptychodera flava]|uniref:uncharacterized protein isoform X1 n=1 Tax=Ptychodera flava TaxID=63121 RepID=UPI00396A90D7
MWSTTLQRLPMYHLPYLRHTGEGSHQIAPSNLYRLPRPVRGVNVRAFPEFGGNIAPPPLPPPTPSLPPLHPRRHTKATRPRNLDDSDLEWDNYDLCGDGSKSNSRNNSDEDSHKLYSSDSDLEWDDFDLRNSGDESTDGDRSLALDNLYPLISSITGRPGRRGTVPLGAIQVNKLPRISCTFAGLAHVPEEFCYEVRSRNFNKDLLTLTSRLNGYDSDIWDSYEEEFPTTKLGKTFSNESLNSDISTVSTQESGYRSSSTVKSRDTPDLPAESTDTSLAESCEGMVVAYSDRFPNYNIYELSPQYLDSPLSASLTDLSDATLCECNRTPNIDSRLTSSNMENLQTQSNKQMQPPTKKPRTQQHCSVCKKQNAWCEMTRNETSSSLHGFLDDNCVVHVDVNSLSACYHYKSPDCAIPTDDLLSGDNSYHQPGSGCHTSDLSALFEGRCPSPFLPRALRLNACKTKRSVKKRKRKVDDKIDDDLAEEIDDDKKPKRLAPNYFVAIQVSNPTIHESLKNVQASVMKSDEKLKDAMIPIPTLHLTVMVMHIANDEELERAKDALRTCHALLASQFEDEALEIPFSGLGHFNNQVMFARIQEGDHVNVLYEIAETVEKVYNQYNIVSTGERGFKPHLTVMKLSRAPSLRRKGVRRIKSEYYRNFNGDYFGSQVVKGLQLCSINKPKLEDGYYYRAEEVFFKAGVDTAEKMETVAMTRLMLDEVVDEALKSVQIDGDDDDDDKSVVMDLEKHDQSNDEDTDNEEKETVTIETKETNVEKDNCSDTENATDIKTVECKTETDDG